MNTWPNVERRKKDRDMIGPEDMAKIIDVIQKNSQKYAEIMIEQLKGFVTVHECEMQEKHLKEVADIAKAHATSTIEETRNRFDKIERTVKDDCVGKTEFGLTVKSINSLFWKILVMYFGSMGLAISIVYMLVKKG